MIYIYIVSFRGPLWPCGGSNTTGTFKAPPPPCFLGRPTDSGSVAPKALELFGEGTTDLRPGEGTTVVYDG